MPAAASVLGVDVRAPKVAAANRAALVGAGLAAWEVLAPTSGAGRCAGCDPGA